jgi:mRNA-degrading endonuclease toxin of MazEF toxin-antitoxin module
MKRTQPTITYKRGDVVLVGFMFADESGWKQRPAVVVSCSAYQTGRQEVIVSAVTSNVKRLLFGDHYLVAWKDAGLLFPSVVTAILRTVKATMIHRKLGSLTKSDMGAVDRELGKVLERRRKS